MNYPSAAKPANVGKYSPVCHSGGGYFYDKILEYRVWEESQLRCRLRYESFVSFEEADAFSKAAGFQPPVALVLQTEYVDEPTPGVFEHVKQERITEWRPEWLSGSERSANSIPDFLRAAAGAVAGAS